MVSEVAMPSRYAHLSIDAERTMSMIEASCAWGSTPDGGMNRLSCNDDDRKVRDWFVDEAKKCGCEIKVDQMGNIFAIRPGQNNNLPPIGLGSHLDTQPTGGRYDGILGVISALEVLKTIHANNVTTYAPLAVVNWTNEEGARFPPAMLCSGVWGGEFSVDYGHSRTDPGGKSLGQELERIGYKGDVPCSYDANPLLAHFEVHIEQGPILDVAKEAIAVVTGVQSMCWYHIDVAGREAHTGTTPMDRRSDALLGAAKIIIETNRFVTEGELAARGARATIAVINSLPQSINTIAGKVKMGLDIRAPADADTAKVEELCRNSFQKIAEEAGLTVAVDRFWTSPALHFDPTMVNCVRESAKSLGCAMELVSGAGHDSVYASRKVPTAMIFVRCRDGISHNPAEYSSPEDCAAGAQTLLGAYLRYDDYVRKSHEGGS
ncbi:putative N-carbamoyl-L-amino acid hydrolase [Pseudomassariella vexata]|uniref:Putative N-carbamoyl-L-amino acid hydrolase n=1 Tax=Pseudomassariella vexata TaxID=1141098 RepID=A0A1Y2E2K7_9PEZI|nr:putative N-carbamoyl-L-amino acid hydrolase [Pseudomassariella vexata]ORY65772.1 putative N-carbamoyl-L-amino acid hydrolase [Pseudomassariella vexata]